MGKEGSELKGESGVSEVEERRTGVMVMISRLCKSEDVLFSSRNLNRSSRLYNQDEIWSS